MHPMIGEVKERNGGSSELFDQWVPFFFFFFCFFCES